MTVMKLISKAISIIAFGTLPVIMADVIFLVKANVLVDEAY